MEGSANFLVEGLTNISSSSSTIEFRTICFTHSTKQRLICTKPAYYSHLITSHFKQISDQYPRNNDVDEGALGFLEQRASPVRMQGTWGLASL